MRILIDLTSLADNFSGIERFALSIARELIKNTENEYILVFKNEVHKDFSAQEKHVKHMVLKGGNKLIFNQIKLPLFLWGQKADCYLFPAFPAPFLFGGKKSVSAIHDVSCWDCPETNKKHMILYFKILYRKVGLGAGKIITVSQFSKDRIVDIMHVKAERVSIIPNGLSQCFLKNEEGIDRDAVHKKYGLPDSYILCLATLEPRKNLKLLIAAYANLVAQNKIKQDLVLAGRRGWMMDDLLTEISPRVASHIHFTGFVEEEDLPVIYSGSDMFVFPSLYEGFGVPPIEAMCMGSVVIASDAGSLPEVLGDAAVYFRSNDREALEKAIMYVEQLEPDVKAGMIAKGKKHALTYTWEKSGRRLNEVLGINSQ